MKCKNNSFVLRIVFVSNGWHDSDEVAENILKQSSIHSRVPNEDPSGRSIILTQSELERIKVSRY